MFILFTNLFLTRPFRLENTLECYNLRGGQGGSTEVIAAAGGKPCIWVCGNIFQTHELESSNVSILNHPRNIPGVFLVAQLWLAVR